MKPFFLSTLLLLTFYSQAQNTAPFWSLAGNNNATLSHKIGTTNNVSLRFVTNNQERMKIFSTGNVGIGTSTPESKLHVVKGSAGTVAAFFNATLVVESSTHNYINILGPDATETGILFGRPASNVSGGIIYNNSFTLNGFQFRTNNNITQMVLTAEGNLGVGTLSPGLYKTKISHGEGGLNLENASSGNNWELVTFTSGHLHLFANDNPKGAFNVTTGAYGASSDERLKTNIKPIATMLNKINQLKPSAYQFKNNTDNQEYNGFIAQDVLKVFPSMVTHNVNKVRNLDIYTIDYSGFGVIAIKGIQELHPIIEEQKEKIAKLESELKKVYELIAKLEKNEGNTSLPTVAWMNQNSPNPVGTSTTIQYYIPEEIRNARVLITNLKGQQIKVYNVSGNGSINFNVGTLPSGSYNYSLIADGKTVNTKQLIIAR